MLAVIKAVSKKDLDNVEALNSWGQLAILIHGW